MSQRVSPDREWLTLAAAGWRSGDVAERDRLREALGRDLLASWDWVAERRVSRQFWRAAAGLCPVPGLAGDMDRLADQSRERSMEAIGGLAVGVLPAPLRPAPDATGDWLCSLFTLREADLAVCAAVCVLRADGGGALLSKALRKMKHDMARPLAVLAWRSERIGLDVDLAELFPVGEQWWASRGRGRAGARSPSRPGGLDY